MKKCNQLLATVGLLAIASSAQATLINFQGLADSVVGESAWTSFSTAPYGANIDITADPSGSHVYFDSGVAGLGVCSRGVNSADANVTHAFSTTNICDPNAPSNLGAADDNIDISGEALVFNFNETIDLNSIWLNSNHDSDFDLTGNTVLFSVNDGAATTYTLSAAEFLKPGTLGHRIDLDMFFSAGDTLSVAFDSSNTGQQFYVSAIDVPEPGPLALLGLGLIGLYAASKKKTA